MSQLRTMTRRAIRRLMLAALGVSPFAGAAQPPIPPPHVEASWAEAACPFDTRRALLPVTCGRLRVPENYDNPVRAIEIAVMVVRARHNIDPSISKSGNSRPSQPMSALGGKQTLARIASVG